jgi:hypothetical protein
VALLKEKTMFKKIAAILAITTFATAAYASCRFYTVTVNGKTISCTECCYGTGAARQCNTTCN